MGGKGGCVLLPLATWRGAGMGLLRGGTSEGAASCGGQGARAAAATFLMFSVLKMPCAGLKCLREVSFGSDNTELCKKKKKRKETKKVINACEYLRGGYRGDGARRFPVVPSDRMRGSGHELAGWWLDQLILEGFPTLMVL